MVCALQIGVIIAGEIFPEAISWFTGKADEMEISDDEDEDDEDEDAEAEIDLEKPDLKRRRRA